ANDQMAWHFDWSTGLLRTSSLEDKVSHRPFDLTSERELALTFSGAVDRLQDPFQRLSQFRVRQARLLGSGHAVFELTSEPPGFEANLHVQLDGPTRRKWVELTNHTTNELLLLDVDLDDLVYDRATSGGGRGQPVFLGEEAFAAMEHPTGDNRGTN